MEQNLHPPVDAPKGGGNMDFAAFQELIGMQTHGMKLPARQLFERLDW